MTSMAVRMCRDEGGTNKAGLVLVMGLILVLLVAATEVGGARGGIRVHRAQDSGSVWRPNSRILSDGVSRHPEARTNPHNPRDSSDSNAPSSPHLDRPA